MLREIYNWYASRKISTKITGIFAAFFLLPIVVLNVVLIGGVSYALYHPAEATIQYSMRTAEKILTESKKYPDDLTFHSIHKALLSGVVLRIFDRHGNLIFDTNEVNYPSNETFEKNIMTKPPILADDDFDVAQLGNALVYRGKLTCSKPDGYLTLYFFRTITSQRNIFTDLLTFILVVNLLGIFFSFKIGQLVSRQILHPIEKITALARKITLESERENVKERIPVPPTNDEITELAKTFNTMLDHMQGDISRHKDFVSNASHELRKPLTVIEGYAEILEKYGDANQALRDESVNVIRDEAQNMQNLLKNLRPNKDENKSNFHKENLNLAEIVDVAFQRTITVEGGNHEVKLIRNDTAHIYGDKAAILQILRIFLDNAIKYTPKGGTVKLSSVKQGDKVFVSIADNGIGIAEKDFNKIFERGVRLSKNPFVNEVDGSGIGLYMAKVIADSHDIKIDVKSTVGKGTIFTLTIPIN